jgi:signal transduction histidine kinase
MVTFDTCPLFRALAPGELEQMRARGLERVYPAGATIFSEGDEGDGCYLVKSGLIQIAAAVRGGKRQVLSKLPPGAVFGEMAVVDNLPRSASAIAEVDSVIEFIPRDSLLAALDHSPGFCLALMRDVTRRLREFDRLYIAKVLEAERLSLVGRFARSIIHDLKNPLAIISLAAELAVQDSSAEVRGQARTQILDQVARLNDLVSDLLEFTRSLGQGGDLVATEFAVFVDGVVREVRPELLLTQVEVELVQAPPAVWVALDGKRLTRALRSLFSNAAEAMPAGGKVRLRFEVAPREVVVQVEDTGPGIVPEAMGRLFEPFSTFGKPSGTGLGLCIARRIVEEHGGRIAASNVPGGGAQFTLVLPRIVPVPQPASVL